MICGGGGGGSGFGERDFSAKEMIACVVTNKEKYYSYIGFWNGKCFEL